MKGFIYVMSNPSLPGLVKIGYSMKDPHMRAGNDFDPAGLPDDYVVEYHALVDNPREVEQLVHARLQGSRYKKEWFRCSKFDAVSQIKLCAQQIYFEDQARVGDVPTPSQRPVTNTPIQYNNGRLEEAARKKIIEDAKAITSKRWIFFVKTQVLQSNRSGRQYRRGEYEPCMVDGEAGYRVLAPGPDGRARLEDIEYINSQVEPATPPSPSAPRHS